MAGRLTWGACDSCTNQRDRYPRQSVKGLHTVWLCADCCDLGRGSTRVYFRNGHEPPGNPRSRPARISDAPKSEQCVHCSMKTAIRYRWIDASIVTACGWGHAGLWMDAQIDGQGEDLTEGITYVLKSLGVEDDA